MNRKIRIVSVGGGWVVNHRHLHALQKSGLFEVAGIVSTHAERAERTARAFQVPHFATDLDFSRDWTAEADAVMIGTVPQVHYEIARRALLAGKHVLTEKPMTVELAHARELRDLAREKKLTLALVHNNQFGRAASKFRRLLDAGVLGKIRTVYGVQVCNPLRKLPAWTDDLPLGLYFDECPHFCYMFRFLAGGDVTLEQATVWKSRGGGHPGFVNTPRMVSATYRGPDGVPIFLHVDFEANLTEWQVAVTTEKATVLIDFWRDIYLYMPNDRSDAPVDLARKTLYATHQHFWGALAAGFRYATGRQLFGNIEVVTRFHRAIHGENCLQGMSPDDGVRVVEMQHELIAKARYLE
jgi:scyllo-inositol 2-dehydrogenase (NADP+)